MKLNLRISIYKLFLGFPVHSIITVAYNTTSYGPAVRTKENGCQLIGNTFTCFKVPKSFGRIYALNSSWTGMENPPTRESVNVSGVTISEVKRFDITLWQFNLHASKPFR
jgi:hypothetical protein